MRKTMELDPSTIYINASLSCIDLGHVQLSMDDINHADIHSLHYDMVDGIFNRCFQFGDRMLEVFQQYSSLPITVHLACMDPLPYLEPIINSGVDYVAVHYESKRATAEVFTRIHELGAKPVLAFRCDTPVPDDFLALASQAEWILKLTVQPGFSGQEFYKEALSHIEEMHRILREAGLPKIIEADGNIHAGTIPDCIQAGATMFTGGTSGLFHTGHSLKESVRILKKAGSFQEVGSWHSQ